MADLVFARMTPAELDAIDPPGGPNEHAHPEQHLAIHDIFALAAEVRACWAEIESTKAAYATGRDAFRVLLRSHWDHNPDARHEPTHGTVGCVAVMLSELRDQER